MFGYDFNMFLTSDVCSQNMQGLNDKYRCVFVFFADMA